MSASSATHAIASRFIAARRAGRSLPDYPGAIPRSLEAAYAIQAEAVRQRGGCIAGWKVGKIAPSFAQAAGAERLVGPIFADLVMEAGDAVRSMPVIAGGFAAAEAEYLLQLGELPNPLPASWTLDDARRVVTAIHLGIEIASSPFPGINDLGPAVTVSDFGNNHGLLVGSPLPESRWDGLRKISVELRIDGAVAGQARADEGEQGPFGAVRFLLELAANLVLPISAGQWVSTGAITGVHRVQAGQAVSAKFDDITLPVRIVANETSACDAPDVG